MHSLKEIALLEKVRPKHWQERLVRVLPQMQSLTHLRANDLQPCMMRAAAVASMRRRVTVTVAASEGQ